ncbi:hypothetical protein BS78_07G173900 [Paspalum vaginatum]|nr:hypothetical protein BS78_07G173900 [Paspalum vaginatum]
MTKISPAFVLFFDCTEEEMERRILGRNQGIPEDNIKTIRKRFEVFIESSLPTIEYYNSKDKVKKIDAAKPIPEVFEDVRAIFTPYVPKKICSTGTRLKVLPFHRPCDSSSFSFHKISPLLRIEV